jgi:hypothetical protein
MKALLVLKLIKVQHYNVYTGFRIRNLCFLLLFGHRQDNLPECRNNLCQYYIHQKQHQVLFLRIQFDTSVMDILLNVFYMKQRRAEL